MVRVTLLSLKITQPMISLLKLILHILLFLASLSLCIYMFVFLSEKWINKTLSVSFSHNQFCLSLFPSFLCFLSSFPWFPQTRSILFNPVQLFFCSASISFFIWNPGLLRWYQSSSFKEFCCASLFLSFFFLLALFLSFIFLFFAMATESESKSIMLANDFNAPHSFLYLQPSENPVLSLVSPVLESQNYHSWSKSFATALSAKNKMQFIDGSAPEPEKADPTYQAWKRCNNMVVSWLTHSISLSIRQSILWMEKSEEIWKDLKSRFSQGNLLRISELQLEASSLKQGSSFVTEYFTLSHVFAFFGMNLIVFGLIWFAIVLRNVLVVSLFFSTEKDWRSCYAIPERPQWAVQQHHFSCPYDGSDPIHLKKFLLHGLRGKAYWRE